MSELISEYSERKANRKQKILLREAICRRYGHPAEYGKTAEDERAKLVNYRAFDMRISGGISGQDIRNHMEAQAHKCYWCGDALNGVYNVDHYVPLKRDGKNTPDNIVIACPGCNRRKKNMMPDEFKKRMHQQAAIAATARPSATANESATSAEEKAA